MAFHGLDSKVVGDHSNCFVASSVDEASISIANYICEAIRKKQAESEEPFVLGLATGNTPIPIYNALIACYKRGDISFANVITINLDEYFPINKDDRNSYFLFMHQQFFNEVDFTEENHHIPSGTLEEDEISKFCEQYEATIRKNGIDIQILGIGRSGHIGFNEPGSEKESKTRLVHLHQKTISDAAEAFGGIENVPKTAITMGIDSIFQARCCILCAWGKSKAEIIKKALTEQPTNQIPATFLQLHPNTSFVLDKAAAACLE